MNNRTAAYLNRKKALQNIPLATDIKSLLIAGLQSSKSLLVKRDILKMYCQISQPRTKNN